tara:strand:- start:293 stop:811 length:519 start_codon:yes stop_codon:yes gene_type:complete
MYKPSMGKYFQDKIGKIGVNPGRIEDVILQVADIAIDLNKKVTGIVYETQDQYLDYDDYDIRDRRSWLNPKNKPRVFGPQGKEYLYDRSEEKENRSIMQRVKDFFKGKDKETDEEMIRRIKNKYSWATKKAAIKNRYAWYDPEGKNPPTPYYGNADAEPNAWMYEMNNIHEK